MKRLAVYCGSSLGASESYKLGAIQLGKELAKHSITLVYGGSSNGLMGAVADTVLQEGGQVIGVIPKVLVEREISHKGLTELFTVDTMHERKAKMAELSDGFVVLPGGTGTLEEFFEVFTWGQIGLHQKPCGLLNIQHYYDPLISLFDHMIEQKFLQEKFRSMVLIEENPDQLLDRFYHYIAPTVKTYD
ncbi:TIGR00730 family Rossman fold protein [Bacillus sp. AFS076308]|uniref:LOG family protein n=1 Tax=unclassified Bacillus (in: firmicutes) TaxID=185979 RepID=UPI000BF7A072|nr:MULTISPECIES: TIGR00730 family Rossman fold protein [unclassified Bacillus (in: firmicutes)]PFN80655.1 TIGR00730 family Rossman fold protein [Bacillus sp. AFS076308]PGV53417.1 TIGR00730 family Rossman fold protein [Bacillus sp. AFS037270]